MEVDLAKLEVKINKLKVQKEQLGAEETPQFDVIELRLKKLLEHFDQIANHQMCPTKKAQIFSLFFKKLPTYQDLEVGTTFKDKSPLVNPVISALNPKTSCLAGQTELCWNTEFIKELMQFIDLLGDIDCHYTTDIIYNIYVKKQHSYANKEKRAKNNKK